MKKYVSSLLFALAFFGSMGHAQEYRTVDATFTFDAAKLSSEAGVKDVMLDLKRQSERACRTVSMVSVGYSIDQDCAKDLLDQAVSKINDESLRAEYAALYLATGR